MKPALWSALMISLLLAGCAASRPAPAVAESPARFAPDERLHGRIATVNETGQFVVVDFNVGALPPLETRMNIYRADEVVGVIRLTGPVRENLVAGDILAGRAAVGDLAIWDREPKKSTEAGSP